MRTQALRGQGAVACDAGEPRALRPDGGRPVLDAEGRCIECAGISMVDYGPFDGDFSGTLVIGNTLEARGALMRHGIDMGTAVGCGPAGAERNSGCR